MAAPALDHLIDQAIAVGRSGGGSPDFMPTLLLELASGDVTSTIVATDGSDRAVALARRMVRDQPAAIRYVIVTRTNLVVDDAGTTRRVLLYEAGSKSDEVAMRFAQPLPPASEREDLEPSPSPWHRIDAWALDWGPARPDWISVDHDCVLHLVSHDLSLDNVDRTIRFVRSRARFFTQHLPDGCEQRVVIDDRGQDLTVETRSALAQLEPELALDVERADIGAPWNLFIEGDVDFEEWAAITVRFAMLEVFPIPADDDAAADAIGVVVPTAALAEAPEEVAEELATLEDELSKHAVIAWDLSAGHALVTEDDWDAYRDAVLVA